MKFLAPSAKQGAIGSILDEGMFEDEPRLRWNARPQDQTRLGEVAERVLQLAFRPASDCGQQIVGKFAANGSTDLRHLLHWREPVKARQQRVVQTGRYC